MSNQGKHPRALWGEAFDRIVEFKRVYPNLFHDACLNRSNDTEDRYLDSVDFTNEHSETKTQSFSTPQVRFVKALAQRINREIERYGTSLSVERIPVPRISEEQEEDTPEYMTGDEYQHLAARTLLKAPERPLTNEEIMMTWCAMGMLGEAGEVAEIIKKSCFHNHPLDKAKLQKEIGDVLWYLAGLCTVAGMDMEATMRVNIDKLMARYPDGFSSAASINRKA